MILEGTVQNGVIVLDPSGFPLSEGTRVEVAPRTGMEPLVTKTPGVCGGRARIGRRRIAVWSLVESRSLGIPDETLMADFVPPLTRAELEAAWRYAAINPTEISRDLRENRDSENA